MSAFWGVVRRLLFLAILGCAFPAAISKELDSGERGEAAPEQSSVPPGPDRLDSPNHMDPESAPPTSTSASIGLLVESAARRARHIQVCTESMGWRKCLIPTRRVSLRSV